MSKISKGKFRYIRALTRWRVFTNYFGDADPAAAELWDKWKSNPIMTKYPDLPVTFTITDLSNIVVTPKDTLPFRAIFTERGPVS